MHRSTIQVVPATNQRSVALLILYLYKKVFYGLKLFISIKYFCINEISHFLGSNQTLFLEWNIMYIIAFLNSLVNIVNIAYDLSSALMALLTLWKIKPADLSKLLNISHKVRTIRVWGFRQSIELNNKVTVYSKLQEY